MARLGGQHPEQREPRVAPATPQWRWTIVNGTVWSIAVGLTLSPWVALLMMLATGVAAAGELWAWGRAGPEGPGWKPLGLLFVLAVTGGAVSIEVFTDESFLLVLGVATPFATALDQIGRGIRAELDDAPWPADAAVEE